MVYYKTGKKSGSLGQTLGNIWSTIKGKTKDKKDTGFESSGDVINKDTSSSSSNVTIRPGTGGTGFSGTSGTGGSSGGSSGSGRKGGGGSSNTSNQVITGVNNISNEQNNIYTGTVTPAKSNTGIVNAVNYWKTNKYDNVWNRARGTFQVATGGIKEDLNRGREDRFNQRVTEFETGTGSVSAKDRGRAFSGYSGTASEFEINKLPDEKLEQLGSLGNQAALVALANRIENKNEKLITIDVYNTKKENEKKINNYVSEIQNKINKGEISYEAGLSAVKEYQDTIETTATEELKKKWETKIDKEQERLDKISKKGRVSRLALTTAATIVASAVLTPVVAGASKGVQVAAGVGTAASFYKPLKKVTTGVIAGTATGLDVAELVIPAAGAIVGGNIGLKIAGVRGVKVDTKLNAALETAQLKSIETVKFTSETQIKALSLDSGTKAELIRQFRTGESIGYKKWKLTNRNPEYDAYIKEKIPDAEIISVGRTTMLDNIYSGNTLVKVSSGKYIQLSESVSVGKYSPNENILVTETLTARAKLNKPVTEVVKTIEITKPKLKVIREEDIVKRLVGGKSYTYEGAKYTVPKGKQITYDNLMEVVRSEKISRYPKQTSSSVELQKLTKASKIDAAVIDDPGTGFGLSAKNVKFITEKSSDVLSDFIKPIEYTKVFDKKMKPFNLPEEVKLDKQVMEKPVSQKTVQLKQPEVINVDALEKSIVQSETKSALKQINKVQEETLNMNQLPRFSFEENKVGLTQKQIERLSANNLTGLKLDTSFGQQTEQKKKNRSSGRVNVNQINNLIDQQAQSPALNLKTLQAQSTSLKIVTPQIVVPAFKYPTVRIPKPIIPPSRKQEDIYKKYQKLFQMQQKKNISAYTSSLGAAAFQSKPIKISRKEYKRLSKKVYTGAETRPTLQITDEDSEKVAKDIVKSVSF